MAHTSAEELTDTICPIMNYSNFVLVPSKKSFIVLPAAMVIRIIETDAEDKVNYNYGLLANFQIFSCCEFRENRLFMSVDLLDYRSSQSRFARALFALPRVRPFIGPAR